MAKGENDRNVGPGVTFYKQGIEGPLMTKKPGAAPKPKVKAKPPVPEKKPVVEKKPEVKLPPRPISKTPAPLTSQPVATSPEAGMEFNPLTSTYTRKPEGLTPVNPFKGIMDSLEENRKKQFEKYGVTSGYKNGGQIRGDGKARVRTKGKIC